MTGRMVILIKIQRVLGWTDPGKEATSSADIRRKTYGNETNAINI